MYDISTPGDYYSLKFWAVFVQKPEETISHSLKNLMGYKKLN